MGIMNKLISIYLFFYIYLLSKAEFYIKYSWKDNSVLYLPYIAEFNDYNEPALVLIKSKLEQIQPKQEKAYLQIISA